MAGKLIAVQGCVLMTDNLTAQAEIATPPSMKVMAENKGCYKGTLNVTVTKATQGTLQQNAPGVGTITGSAQKVLIEGSPAVLEGDKTMIPVICPAVDTSTGAPGTISVTVTIQSAGQTKVQGV